MLLILYQDIFYYLGFFLDYLNIVSLSRVCTQLYSYFVRNDRFKIIKEQLNNKFSLFMANIIHDNCYEFTNYTYNCSSKLNIFSKYLTKSLREITDIQINSLDLIDPNLLPSIKQQLRINMFDDLFRSRGKDGRGTACYAIYFRNLSDLLLSICDNRSSHKDNVTMLLYDAYNGYETNIKKRLKPNIDYELFMIMKYAIIGNRLNILILIHEFCSSYINKISVLWGNKLTNICAKIGRFECLKFLCEVMKMTNYIHDNASLNAVKYNYFDILKYLHKYEIAEDSDEMCFYAAKNGNLELLKYLHENGYEYTGYECHNVANLECLTYLLGTNNSFDTFEYLKIPKEMRLYCLKYLTEHNKFFDNLIEYAAFEGDLECIKYLQQCGYEINGYECEYAALGNHLNCLEHFYENEYEFNELERLAAIEGDSLECLMYLDDIEYEFKNDHTNECLIAVKFDSVKCLTYLVELKQLVQNNPGKIFKLISNCIKYNSCECLRLIVKDTCYNNDVLNYLEGQLPKIIKFNSLECFKYLDSGFIKWNYIELFDLVSETNLDFQRYVFECIFEKVDFKDILDVYKYRYK